MSGQIDWTCPKCGHTSCEPNDGELYCTMCGEKVVLGDKTEVEEPVYA